MPEDRSAEEEDEAEEEDGEGSGGMTSCRSSSESVSFEQRSKGGKRVSHGDILGKNISERRNSICFMAFYGIFSDKFK